MDDSQGDWDVSHLRDALIVHQHKMIQRTLFTGFDLDLYSDDELPYIFWYMSECGRVAQPSWEIVRLAKRHDGHDSMRIEAIEFDTLTKLAEVSMRVSRTSCTVTYLL